MTTQKSYQITPQKPISSGFSKDSTAAEVLEGIDLTGKTAIVTGGYSGIGIETTRALADRGAVVIVPARSVDKAETSLKGIPNVEIETLDLMDPGSIDAFADRFLESERPLDILINNAGIMTPPLMRDARGYESQFATNHLGHFQLTARLWPALKQADGARVVTVSSAAHMYGGIDFDDPNFETREYNKGLAYAQSKSANALFTAGLDKRGYAHHIRAFAVHPGGIKTDLFRYISEAEAGGGGITDFKTEEQGAATSVWCATDPQLNNRGGVYCADADIAETASSMDDMPNAVFEHALDPHLAERLWELSEDLTGVAFSGGSR
ncbi:NAD(P)-dependent dehydrogenase (short-subunit alcohol dehydrogenase family) [Sinobaca qinghaiensis]|uniref:NAD(P)-dependent dehydrogenase (Short-subunit alcohol dehydrogenase family) n=1 Tax=Sinobaca qinghaiensis TaxID=342944 RepID=A0A419V083_9BACL|nr:SDR family NAD(P)-dependent oxidoreductase [Sinobaca qinghaiensis]RKD71347.1 NAD(P)-dependent dehydrogenase (short-subunit alcohol dehydrogenase family) [Sinobaca qinghaiensis]